MVPFFPLVLSSVAISMEFYSIKCNKHEICIHTFRIPYNKNVQYIALIYNKAKKERVFLMKCFPTRYGLLVQCLFEWPKCAFYCILLEIKQKRDRITIHAGQNFSDRLYISRRLLTLVILGQIAKHTIF